MIPLSSPEVIDTSSYVGAGWTTYTTKRVPSNAVAIFVQFKWLSGSPQFSLRCDSGDTACFQQDFNGAYYSQFAVVRLTNALEFDLRVTNAEIFLQITGYVTDDQVDTYYPCLNYSMDTLDVDLDLFELGCADTECAIANIYDVGNAQGTFTLEIDFWADGDADQYSDFRPAAGILAIAAKLGKFHWYTGGTPTSDHKLRIVFSYKRSKARAIVPRKALPVPYYTDETPRQQTLRGGIMGSMYFPGDYDYASIDLNTAFEGVSPDYVPQYWSAFDGATAKWMGFAVPLFGAYDFASQGNDWAQTECLPCAFFSEIGFVESPPVDSWVPYGSGFKRDFFLFFDQQERYALNLQDYANGILCQAVQANVDTYYMNDDLALEYMGASATIPPERELTYPIPDPGRPLVLSCGSGGFAKVTLYTRQVDITSRF